MVARTGFLLLLLFSFFLFSGSTDIEGGERKNPLYSGELDISQLDSAVSIIRDYRGKPHIYASNEHDLYFATGFVTAQERLWQMDLIRRSSSGRLAEIFGKKYYDTDVFLRYLNIPGKSKVIIENQDPEILKTLVAFCDGINYFINSCNGRFPLEFRLLSYSPEYWKLEDITGIIGLMGWSLSEHNLDYELFNYRLGKMIGPERASLFNTINNDEKSFVFPDYKCSNEAITDVETGIAAYRKIVDLGVVGYPASNNWAVSGIKSATGKPLLSNDMHLSISSPGIWMEMHQVIPGKLNVTGVLIPGEPYIIAGHNESVAWGLTNMFLDDIDLFAEKINNDSSCYFFNGEWHPLSSREEVIRQKNGHQDTLLIKSTHRGPVISHRTGIGTDAISMKWSGADISDEVRTFYLINRANNWNDFRNGLSTFRSMGQNFAYADTAGNIGLISGCAIPVRKNNGNCIRDGQTDEFDWKGYLPFEDNPVSFNPESGHLSSANNRTVSPDFPYFINSCFHTPFRINRIREMLEEKELLSVDDFRRMINDQHSNCASQLVPLILSLTAGISEFDKIEEEGLKILAEWDFDMNVDAIAPAIFDIFRFRLLANLLSDELGELYVSLCTVIADNLLYHVAATGKGEWIDNVNTVQPESLQDIVLKSYRESVQELSKHYGRDPVKWKWGKIHTISVEHPLGTVGILDLLFNLNSDKYPVGGSYHTVSMFCSTGYDFKVSVGQSVRNIFNTADWDESYCVIPTGISGIPGSEFYLSQTETFLEGGSYKDHFSQKAVKENTLYTLLLKNR